MNAPSNLPMLFDLAVGGVRRTYPAPTPQSVERIESHLGCALPLGLIDLATQAVKFASWFSSLGEDVQSPDHIIRVNASYKRRRMRRHRRWVHAKPRNLVVINLGFDRDCDCLNLDTRNVATGEYEIWYWTPNLDPVPIARDFRTYVSSLILGWTPHRGPKRDAFNAAHGDGLVAPAWAKSNKS